MQVRRGLFRTLYIRENTPQSNTSLMDSLCTVLYNKLLLLSKNAFLASEVIAVTLDMMSLHLSFVVVMLIAFTVVKHMT